MGKSFSSNTGIGIRWDIFCAKGRRQAGLVDYLSKADSLTNKKVGEKVVRTLTNRGYSYSKRVEQVEGIISDNGYSFSDADLSYFLGSLWETRDYVEGSSRRKGKEVVNRDSVLARIDGLRGSLESVLREGGEKKRVEGLKADITGRLNSGFYKERRVLSMEFGARSRRYQVRKEREEAAEKTRREEHPYLSFVERNVNGIKNVAAALVIGFAGIAIAKAPEVATSTNAYVSVLKVPSVDVSLVGRENAGDSLVSVVGSNRGVGSSDEVESYAVKPISSVSGVGSKLVASGSLEVKVDVGLVEEKKGSGVFSRAGDSLVRAGNYVGAGLAKAATRLKEVGDGLVRVYDSGKERLANIERENKGDEGVQRLSVVGPMGAVGKGERVDDAINKKYPYVLRITRSEHRVRSMVHFCGKRVPSPFSEIITQESRGLMSLSKRQDILPRDFEKEIVRVDITHIDVNRNLKYAVVTGEQWRKGNGYVPDLDLSWKSN